MNAKTRVNVVLDRLDRDFKGYRRLMTTLAHLYVEEPDGRIPARLRELMAATEAALRRMRRRGSEK